ncbi:hypothetical protein [Halospina sp. K52047b]|jgi:hypothetical protein|uniref:hypothetical protein n=1 Tax=Halospina sp. K52047b TaxID=2614160 RepID=UPI00124A49A0|nr:hypothetical protein [Halospina sp. K52047b]KAA8983477.1 hypothetical protein F3089_05465 [Halospina sp. K52047b]
MDSSSPDPDRRQFLRLGFQGGVAAGGALVLAGLAGCSARPTHDPMIPATTADPDRHWRFMTEEDRVVMAALLPAIVGPGMPREAEARNSALSETLVAMDEAFHAMGPPNQRQFRQLFDLLESSITRLTLARVSSYWPNVSGEQAEAFLQRWRGSMFNIFNQAYLGLIQVSNAAWYGQPAHWEQMGYPGPPAYTYDALPQMQKASA